MPTINPQNFRWRAPTQNVDGTPITSPLDYELGQLVGGEMQPMVVIIGELQPDGLYEAPVSDMSFEEGEHTVALRAINVDRPESVSDWSNQVTFIISDEVPEAPLDFSVV